MSRWITVANRLPFSLSADGKTIRTSSGGLVSALNGVQSENEKIWLGCAPENLDPRNWAELKSQLGKSPNSWTYQPVFTSAALYDSYYNGACNDVLWPLLHYQSELVDFSNESWRAYQEVNAKIAHEIAEIARPDDLIWIHDFHLFLVPKILKALRPGLRVGFFLHVPFPSSEVFRQLPVREEILNSLLEADLVGFHDYSYLRHFGSSILRLLGVESSFLSVRRGEKVTRLGVFPVSIDTDNFLKKSREPKVIELAKAMEKPIFTFLGVDRLDYMKGLDLKLKAFRSLLRHYPQSREKVRLIQVAVPTREGVPVYAKLARDTAQLVGEVNGEFSTSTWAPIHYLHSSVRPEELLALYRVSDALLVSSKRDGMNLVALEYIASQSKDRPGVVLLSEFAGAISTLSHALPINPWDLEDTARKMHLAMEMPRQEKISRQEIMQDYLRRYTSTDWAESFIADLGQEGTREEIQGPAPVSLEPLFVQKFADRILESHAHLQPAKVVLFIDYDGTLVPIETSPELAVLNSRLKRELKILTRYSWLKPVIISGRDSRFLQGQFEGLNLTLTAEHGAKLFDPETGRWQRRIHRSRSSWYPTAAKIISDYTARVPRSQIEKKHYSIAWHYRQSPTEYGDFQARKLAEELELGLANLPVSILRGKKVIEVRAVEADKGVFARTYMASAGDDAVAVAIGDDRTDEDLFLALKGRGISIRVGEGPSAADFMLESQTDVIEFLRSLIMELDRKLRLQSAGKARRPPADLAQSLVH